MPLSTQTLGWETAATFFIHAVIPFAIGLGILALKLDITALVSDKRLMIPWIILYALISFLVNTGFLAQLQIEGCSGLKHWTPILTGAAKSLGISLLFVLIPLFSEWQRLLISQLFIRHLPLAVPGQEQINTVTVEASDAVESIAAGLPPPTGETVLTGIGGVLGEADYKRQTFNELGAALAYMSAFGGAIGFAAGSWGVTSCKGSSQ
jgi:hypothetical protein